MRLLPLLVAFLVLAGVLPEAGSAREDLSEAEGAFARGEREEAGRIVRDYVREHPESARSTRVAALIARTSPKPSEAILHWDEVLALDPEGAWGAQAHWMKGLHAYSAGLYVAATREFAALASSAHFDRGRALLWKGRAELGADVPEEAYASFEEAERVASDREDVVSARLGLAHASFRLGNLREALRRYERFERAGREDGRASSAARRAVECLRLLGRETEASAQAARIEREYPRSVEATLVRAEMRDVHGEPERDAEAEPASRGPFVVQVAAMTDPRNAIGLRRQIRALGIDEIRIEQAEGREGRVHRVLLGPYPTEEEARSIAASVAALGDLNPRVREARRP